LNFQRFSYNDSQLYLLTHDQNKITEKDERLAQFIDRTAD